MKPVTIEELLVWTYRDECAWRLGGASGAAGYGRTAAQAMVDFKALGCVVAGSGGAGDDIHPDALAVDQVVSRLAPDARRQVIYYARTGGRPPHEFEWRLKAHRTSAGDYLVMRAPTDGCYDESRYQHFSECRAKTMSRYVEGARRLGTVRACHVVRLGPDAQRLALMMETYRLWWRSVRSVWLDLVAAQALAQHTLTGFDADAEPFKFYGYVNGD